MLRSILIVLILFFVNTSSALVKPTIVCYANADSGFMLSESTGLNSFIFERAGLQPKKELKTLFIWNNNHLFRIVCTVNTQPIPKSIKRTDLKSVLQNIFFSQNDQVQSFETCLQNISNLINSASRENRYELSTSSEGTELKSIQLSGNIPPIPIIFTNSETKKNTYLTAFYINVYELEISAVIHKMNLKRSLFIPDAIGDGIQMSLNVNHNLHQVISEYTLGQFVVFTEGQKIEKTAFSEELSAFDLVKQKYHFVDSSGVILDLEECVDNIHLSKRINSCRSPLDCSINYEYDPYCYNPNVRKSIRIYNHCPFNISSVEYSYIELINNYPIFKINSSNSFCRRWQLIIPNVGYWMTNIESDDSGDYFKPDFRSSLFEINDTNITDFLNSK